MLILDTGFKTPYLLTSSTNFPLASPTSSIGSIVTTMPTTKGKWVLWTKITWSYHVNFRLMFGT